MSAVQEKYSSWWSIGQKLDEYTKYEKCRNITEEIYKRINQFEVKKTDIDVRKSEQSDLSDNSDQIDSNELSNGTDLFACDKSDITSSTEAERPSLPPPVVNINNNNEEKKKPVYKRPRKRFRKRVKKRPPHRKRSDSDGSSDEAPLARTIMMSPDLKPNPIEKVKIPQKDPILKDLLKPTENVKIPTVMLEKLQTINAKDICGRNSETIDNERSTDKKATVVKVTDWKSCALCNLSFRGDRGLRRHMAMSHISPESI